MLYWQTTAQLFSSHFATKKSFNFRDLPDMEKKEINLVESIKNNYDIYEEIVNLLTDSFYLGHTEASVINWD